MTTPTESRLEVSAPLESPVAPKLVLGVLERSAILRVLLLLGGLVLPQFILIGPSLCGRRVLLPLRLLASPRTYLPRSLVSEEMQPQDQILGDLVLGEQPAREFSAREFRSGRLPLWDPLSYAGAPFAAFGKYGPFELLYLAFPVPVTLAWMQLLKAVVAGLGSYLFFRRVLGAGAVAALAGGWCYPVTGFLLLWQGFAVTAVVVWFPWLLLAAWHVVVRPAGWGGPALAAVTTCAMLGGHMDIAGQALLACGLFALWTLWDRYGLSRKLAGPALALSVAWAVGFALAAPYWLPLVDYARTGDRMYRRQAGSEERPPAGLSVLPQTVLPRFYGSPWTDSAYLGETGNLMESASATYVGLLATLLAAPLAWCGRHRRQAWFWLGLGLLGLSWQLNVPGIVALLRLPGIRMLSHNRFVFVTGFALLTLAVCGLDELAVPGPERHWWFALPAGLLVLLSGASVMHATESADHLARQVEQKMREVTHEPAPRIPRAEAERIGATSVHTHLWGLVLCLGGLAGWALIARQPARPWAAPVLGLAMLGELVIFGWDLSPQSDPALYYPRLPILEQLAQAPPGRFLSVFCLPADLHKRYGLRTVCGYDGVDPHLILDLLYRARDPSQPFGLDYARVRSYVPVLQADLNRRPQLPKILDMLNIRYLLFYRPPSPPDGVRPLLEWEDYWAVENPNCLPRAFVPRRVATRPAGNVTLAHLGSNDFDPRQVAYIAEAVELPERCSGQAEITAEEPCRVEVAVDMRTAGLLVLADQWDAGWRATVDGRPAPVLRTNHALRGVAVPAGRSLVCFRYQPDAFSTSLRLLTAALLGSVVWVAWLVSRRLLVPLRKV